jgi:hypothetical protein
MCGQGEMLNKIKAKMKRRAEKVKRAFLVRRAIVATHRRLDVCSFYRVQRDVYMSEAKSDHAPVHEGLHTQQHVAKLDARTRHI